MKIEDIKKCLTLKNERLQLGLANELHYNDEIIKYFGIQFPNIKHTENNYNSFDWEGENLLLELKSRMCKKHTYSTTIIGYDKVKKALKYIEDGKGKVFFLFAFLDTGLGAWELTNESLKGLEVEKGGCHIRYEQKTQLYIPVEQIVDIIDKKPLTNENYNKLKKTIR